MKKKSSDLKCLIVRTHRHVYVSVWVQQVINWVVRYLSLCVSGRLFKSRIRTRPFFLVCYFYIYISITFPFGRQHIPMCAVCFTTEYDSSTVGPDIVYLVCIIWIQSTAASADAMYGYTGVACCCCCCCCCCCLLLLLFVILCGMEKNVAGSLNLIPVFSSSSSEHDLFLMYDIFIPLAVLSHLRPRFACTTSSVITGMRGAMEVVSPPRRNPLENPCIDMLAMSSQQSSSQILTRFWVVNALARDEVHPAVWCLVDVPPDSAGGGLDRASVVSLREKFQLSIRRYT